jgi:hypothetical protein
MSGTRVVHGEEARVDGERQTDALGPARQFLQAIALALGRALHQGQPTRRREHGGEVDRMVAHRDAGPLGHGPEPVPGQKGPGRMEPVVDVERQLHGSSPGPLA